MLTSACTDLITRALTRRRMQANIAYREADGEHGMEGIILRAHLPPALRQLATSAEMKAFEVCACLCTSLPHPPLARLTAPESGVCMHRRLQRE